MYLFVNFICFYSNIFGYETKVKCLMQLSFHLNILFNSSREEFNFNVPIICL